MTIIDLDDSVFNEHSRAPFPDEQEELIVEQGLPGGRSSTTGGSPQNTAFQYPSTLNDNRRISKKQLRAAQGGGGEPDGIRRSDNPKMKRVKKNRAFMDVEETGKWGTVSRREIIGVVLALLLVVAGGVVGLIFWLDDNGPDVNIIGAPPDQPAEPSEKLYLSQQEYYRALILKIQDHGAVADTILRYFPENVDDLDASRDVYTEAAVWMCYTDDIPTKYESNILPRFTLAVTYLANGGSALEWTNRHNWMTVQDVCDWYGVTCDPAGEITEVDLSSNGLTGDIHLAWNLLDECGSLFFSDNYLTGPIPGKAFGNMANLVYLYLNNNLLTGEVPLSLKDTDSIGTYYVVRRVCVCDANKPCRIRLTSPFHYHHHLSTTIIHARTNWNTHAHTQHLHSHPDDPRQQPVGRLARIVLLHVGGQPSLSRIRPQLRPDPVRLLHSHPQLLQRLVAGGERMNVPAADGRTDTTACILCTQEHTNNRSRQGLGVYQTIRKTNIYASYMY